jgi:hypothetical protein
MESRILVLRKFGRSELGAGMAYVRQSGPIEAAAEAGPPAADLFMGGRNDNQSNWEGRLDEVAFFDRPLSAEEVATLSP